jgi:BirA family biotin operon repressor/biotin-[acetyl-CoA-carboxylase] ligase
MAEDLTVGHSVDRLDRAEILQGLQTREIGRVLHVHDEVTSTNDLAMALAESGAPHGTAVVAERQARGRGRLGRAWDSPAGLGLWASVVLRPEVPAAQAPAMTLAAGLAAAEAIEAEADVAAALKWPNDVLLDGRKVAGILTELRTRDQAVAHLVVGIGINVHQGVADFPPDLAETAISIRQAAGRAVSRVRLLQCLFARLEAWSQRFVAEGSGAVVAAAAARMPMLGQRVVAVAGTERWEGTAARLDGDGALVIALPGGGTRRVLAAEVTLPGAGG